MVLPAPPEFDGNCNMITVHQNQIRASQGIQRADFGEGEPRVIRGLEPVMKLQASLMQLAIRTGQAGVMDDLRYFLTLPQSEAKEPCLLVWHASETDSVPARLGFNQDRRLGESGPDGAANLLAAVLLFQYRILGVGCRVYSTADTTGRRTVLAPASLRAHAAACAARTLLNEGSQISLITFQQPNSPQDVLSEIHTVLASSAGAKWALEVREVPLYLPLKDTFDGTLARIGQRTRSNLRYYRRRAERDLGCIFTANVELPLADFLSFNRVCKYAISDKLARWRWSSLLNIRDPFLHGIRDRDGRWLALVCGRRQNGAVEIDWQCNRADLPMYSLSTVIRAYLIEHEVARGAERMYIEGGTPNPIQQSFVCESAMDFTVVRRTIYTRAIRRLLPEGQFPKNHVSQVIADARLTWHNA